MDNISSVPHPIFTGKTIRLPSAGKLKWLGGNLAFDYPISEDVIDDEGNWLSIGLEEVLSRLNDFEGHRGSVSMAENLLDRAFTAYEFGLMTDEEKAAFENYVRKRVKGINSLNMVKNGLLADFKHVNRIFLGN
ncbi:MULTISPECIES: hypothetical protein [unclassified Methylophilus]|uniref:hypothetical protein n=1 Tax=unclassified Methylophilus TaxID=2630143 RepID=UPI0006FEB6CD|nr:MULTISPECIES: hypothetical protein [unclassified Methylophilus]KQT42236.1 hypothetical protein ASG34_05610 [Methylophilus sp. Leaf416]KQT56418.1 hypothetical protein ASG44_05585 [Methylophilus sp. Leaf459]